MKQLNKPLMKRTIIFAAALLLTLSAQAQVAVISGGGDASGGGGSVNSSVGQIVYTIAVGRSGSMIQGVQQPYEISVGTGSPGIPDINLTLSAYPNPATDILTLDIGKFDGADLVYRLFDINGKLIETGMIKSSTTSINMSGMSPGTYFVKVAERTRPGHDPLKTFKIIKR
jgi:hypothetical protein